MKKIDFPVICYSEPLKYWETCDGSHGGVIVSINKNGLRIRSHVNVRLGGELRLSVFFMRKYGFDGFQLLAKILRKDVYSGADWETYEYDLGIIKISQEDHLKLRYLLKFRKAREIYS